jgi:O-antigen ligase
VLGFARRYGLDVATSGRWGLIVEKLRDFASEPLWQKLLGRGPDPEKTYFPMSSNFGYSHNSYLDMITGFGLVGFCGLLWWFLRTVRRGRLLGATAPQPYKVPLALARVALLLHAATLSMYLNRVFLFFFLG